jgi:hypothetical protein
MMEISVIPAFLSFIVFLLCVLIYRVQRHPFWYQSMLSSFFLSLSLAVGSAIFMVESPGPLPVLFVGLGVVAIYSQGLAVNRLANLLRQSMQPSGEMELRNDIAALGEYSSLTSEFISRISPLVGIKAVREIVEKHVSRGGLLQGCELTNGNLNIRPAVERLQMMDSTEGMRRVFTSFLHLHLDLMELCKMIMSYDDAVEKFDEALASVAGHYGIRIYRYALPLLLVGKFIGPALSGSKDASNRINEEIIRFRENPLLSSLRIEGGNVTLENFYTKLSQLKPEEMIESIISSFSRFMEICCSADEEISRRAEARFSTFSDFLTKHPALVQYDVVRIVPKKIKLPPHLRLMSVGKSFIIKDSTRERAFEVFRQLLGMGIRGLCVTTIYPETLRKERGLENVTMVWLSAQEMEGAVSPTDLDVLRHTIEEFMRKNRGCVVMLEGIEYLSTINGFSKALEFLYDVKNSAVLHGSRLLIPLNPDAFTQAQLANIESRMEAL